MDIFAVIVIAGTIVSSVSTPTYENKVDCVKDVQEVGYPAMKSQVDPNVNVKIYCIDPKKDYTNMEKITVSNLKDADLVPEKDVGKVFK